MIPPVREVPAQLYRRDEGVDHARRFGIHRTAGGEHAHRNGERRIKSSGNRGFGMRNEN
jgi:hypothetical protein